MVACMIMYNFFSSFQKKLSHINYIIIVKEYLLVGPRITQPRSHHVGSSPFHLGHTCQVPMLFASSGTACYSHHLQRSVFFLFLPPTTRHSLCRSFTFSRHLIVSQNQLWNVYCLHFLPNSFACLISLCFEGLKNRNTRDYMQLRCTTTISSYPLQCQNSSRRA